MARSKWARAASRFPASISLVPRLRYSIASRLLTCEIPATGFARATTRTSKKGAQLRIITRLRSQVSFDIPNDFQCRVVRHLRDVAQHLKRLLLLLQNVLQIDVRKLCVVTYCVEFVLPARDLVIEL